MTNSSSLGAAAIIPTALVATLIATLVTPLAAEPRHGLSAFGDLKYKPDFQHFDYVNPNAPKGGRLSQIGVYAIETFDSFNPFILKGDAVLGAGINGDDRGLVFDALMTRALDEPDAVYGLVARTADLSPDHRSVTFALRPEARFSDGAQITPADVCFTFETLKAKGHPSLRSALRDVASCTVGPASVRYDFKGESLRDLPLVVATLPILSKQFYTDNNFEESSLKKPLSSGPYMIGPYEQGRYVSYLRRPDYWAADLPVNRGQFNFDEIRFEYFRDRTASLQAFTAGDYDLREEFVSRDWATAYNIPQVKDGRILLLTLPDHRASGMQGFWINTRRDKFKDPRVRLALDYIFDYEWLNKNLFYGAYTRVTSFFENTDMKAVGPPTPAELKLMEPFRSTLPAEVFAEPYLPPVTDGSGADRKQLAIANQLLNAAGWQVVNGKRTNAKGEVLDLEIMISADPSAERVTTPMAELMKRMGVMASLRRLEAAEYQRREKSYDFDSHSARLPLSLTPGTELLHIFSSEAARNDGTFNLAGIESPAVDALVANALAATSREDLNTAMRALDRVLRAGHYWVPEWYKPIHTLAVWDKFGRPPVQPRYDRGIETWWYDPAKAAKAAAK